MYTKTIEDLDFTRNEARIYEALLQEGELGIGAVAVKSGVHRRNAHDSLIRLIEKGLVFQTITSKENRYRATDPKKLLELVKEKESKVEQILPDLQAMYQQIPTAQDTFVYRGVEGWKNYMRDVAQVGEDIYAIGVKGTWEDPRLEHIFAQTVQIMKEKGITINMLLDGTNNTAHEVFQRAGIPVRYRQLPPDYANEAAVDVFGDHVVIFGDTSPGTVVDDVSLTVLISRPVANTFRAWFDLLWIASAPSRKPKARKATKKK